MIPIANDYNTAQAYDGQANRRLTPGGHICRIQRAYMSQSRAGNDMLVIEFDIDEGGEFDGWFRQQYQRAYKAAGSAAKWRGCYYLLLKTPEGATNGRFKAFMEAVEQSNSGYDFVRSGGDEAALKNRTVGFCFQEEEYIGNDNNVRVSVKPIYAVPVSRIRDGLPVPEMKRLENRPIPPASEDTEVEDPGLPF